VSPRTGRRAGVSDTRAAIAAAARDEFARSGYDRATIRAIARAAGVDPALVHHYYSTKEKLFVAVMRFPAVPSEVLAQIVAASPDRWGQMIARTIVGIWDDAQGRTTSLALLRSAVSSETAARMLREFVSSAILGRLAEALGVPDAPYRASLVGSQIVGLGMARFVLCLEPLASAGVDDLVAAIAPTLQRYLTGDVRA
jgi:AcrR family transcriptional regulator